MSLLWNKSNPDSVISLDHPFSYADRLRIRQPGDASFALGPHIDGGSVERWEKEGYGRGGVYDKILEGRYEEYDPWDASGRVDAVNNRYDGLGACSMFRMWQGWMSMSHTLPGEGTLLVNPLVKLSMAYVLLRPFFQAKKFSRGREYLDDKNWEFMGERMDSELQGATLGKGQELTDELHPHLELKKSMVHVPEIRPGDFVAWHCDSKSLVFSGPRKMHANNPSNPRRRQSPQRNHRLKRALHPRMSRDGAKRRVHGPAALSLPAGHTGAGLPRRRGGVGACGSACGGRPGRAGQEGHGAGGVSGGGVDGRGEGGGGEGECAPGLLTSCVCVCKHFLSFLC